MRNSCNIAAEGTMAKLYRSDNSSPDGDDGFMYLLIPAVHRYLQQAKQYRGGVCLGSVFAALATTDAGFQLREVSFRNGSNSGVELNAKYVQYANVDYAIYAGWVKSRYVYIIREDGTVQVHDWENVEAKNKTMDLAAYLPHEALQVVMPDIHAPRKHPGLLN